MRTFLVTMRELLGLMLYILIMVALFTFYVFLPFAGIAT